MGQLFAKTEGIIPAPEANHAIAAAIREAKNAKSGQVVLFNLCGHGHFDMTAWAEWNEVEFLQTRLSQRSCSPRQSIVEEHCGSFHLYTTGIFTVMSCSCRCVDSDSVLVCCSWLVGIVGTTRGGCSVVRMRLYRVPLRPRARRHVEVQ